MTRDEKAALRAKAREQRRRPRDEESEAARDDEQAEEPESKQEDEPRRNGRSQSKQQEPQHGAPSDELGQLAAKAGALLRSLRGVDAESVSGLTRTRNGWKVTLEVLELRRIPESTDVLASYDVELDENGDFLRFERGRRYHRSQAENGGGR